MNAFYNPVVFSLIAFALMCSLLWGGIEGWKFFARTVVARRREAKARKERPIIIVAPSRRLAAEYQRRQLLDEERPVYLVTFPENLAGYHDVDFIVVYPNILSHEMWESLRACMSRPGATAKIAWA